jgi:hypothetical protein
MNAIVNTRDRANSALSIVKNDYIRVLLIPYTFCLTASIHLSMDTK